MKNRTLPLGIAIIAAGIFIALGKLGFFQALGAWFWPLLPLAAGGLLLWAVWTRRLPSAAYVPAAFLVGASIAFLLCAWFGWHWMKALWPLLPLSLAAGAYLFAEAERIPPLRSLSLGVGAASLLALLVTLLVFVNGFVVALVLIVAGVAVIARRPNFR
ncbi:hypothetical protein FE782_20275 [Paenibacillus antri]|uniref:DUF5668 domain-containing protein n=1 Tax=Paenibacillus antri TaxID=2582848 RepID=A0A5R9G7K7_9BACL|nr:hypothetical protein [Paenibacillus antri]TLS50366.1 hypothetical protein FE782_20275 [Paenibacillus antri]